MKTYNKTFTFGKIAYNGQKVKTNLVELEMKLKPARNGKPVFSVSGDVWNASHSDILCGGQCVDDIYRDFASQIKNPSLYLEIMQLWEKWHLNDMHAECKHQEAKKQTWATNPSIKCKTCGWILGHGWDYRAIEHRDLMRIMAILEIEPAEQNTIRKMA